MTECQGCGAWNERRRTLCVLCGTPLAETDEWEATAELPPLPPLPDGGLSATMPAWLRALPGFAAPAPEPAAAAILPATAPSPASTAPPSYAAATLGPQADPRTFLTDDDFPAWIRALASRAPQPPATAPAEATSAAAPWPAWPAQPAPPPSLPPGQESMADIAHEEALPPLSAPLPPREQTVWETILLLLLALGILGAALWALASYGVLRFGS